MHKNNVGKVIGTEVLVIGAGPTGLTAALTLASHNIHCRIVECRTMPSELSRAVGIMPTTIDAIQPLGVSDAIMSEAMPLRKIHLTRSGRTLMFLDNTAPEFRNRVIIGLPQNRTEEILRDALLERGVNVEYGVSAEKITTDSQQATVKCSDGTTKAYDWVIAADGTQSVVREQLGIAYRGHDLPGEWSIADVDVTGDFDPEVVSLDIQAPGNKFTMILPIEPRRARIVSSTPDALAALSDPLKIANVRRTRAFRISIRQAETYHKGRVLLAGDAAHCHSPIGGKGMNLGMADAMSAARAIVNDQVGSYSKERHRIGSAILKKTEGARIMVTSNNSTARIVIWAAAKTISSFPFAHRAFMRFLTQI